LKFVGIRQVGTLKGVALATVCVFARLLPAESVRILRVVSQIMSRLLAARSFFQSRPLRMLVWGACPRGSDLPCGRITLTGVATP